MSEPAPILLALFDGWGWRPETLGNVLATTDTPNWDQLWEAYPHALLAASGPAVGLGPGTPGSAAAAFATIAAGRPLEQPAQRLDRAIASGEFAANETLRRALTGALERGGRVHLLGLVSDGQVLSAERHYFALLRLCAELGLPGERVVVHAILDGYDTPARSGVNYLARLAAEMMRTGVGRVGTLLGRSYGLAAAGRWEATERAWAALVHGAGRLVPSAIQAIQAGYSRGEDDVTLSPAAVLGSDGLPLGVLRDGDALICFNHRPDGLERLLEALLADDFTAFGRDARPAVEVVTLGAWGLPREFGVRAAFAEPEPPPSLGQRLTRHGRRLGLVGESLMERHLRRLTAGARSELVSERFLPSPPVDEVLRQPERLTTPLTEAAVELLTAGVELVVVDYCNVDLAGHAGRPELAAAAVRALDAALSPLVRTARKVGATMLLTACYGNVEDLELARAEVANPAHTANPVPLLLIADRYKGQRLAGEGLFSLADLTATILALLELPAPREATGRALVELLAPAGDEPAAPGTPPLEIDAAAAVSMGIVVGQRARDYYRAAAARAGDPDSQALYRHLAAEEDERVQALLRRQRLLHDAGEPPPPAAGPAPEPPEPGLPPLTILDRAIREELETWRLWCEIAARTVDPRGKAVLEELAVDELTFLGRLRRLSESEAMRLLATLPAGARGEV